MKLFIPSQFKSLFSSQDSKFYLKTAFSLTIVPILTLLLIFYSLLIYINLNYSFYLSLGFPNDPLLKSAFIDQVILSISDYIPWVALFLCAVFFIGFLISYLILKPFHLVTLMCREYYKDTKSVYIFDPLNKQKLVVKTGLLLINYCKHRESKNKEIFIIPKALKKIDSPVADFVFYFQYFSFMIILNIITLIGVYFCIQQIQQAIIANAISYFKMNSQSILFLSSQQNNIDMIFMASMVFSVTLYTVISRGIIINIEGVSYGLLRDIKNIINGNQSIRLTGRSKDPGKETIKAMNRLINFL